MSDRTAENIVWLWTVFWGSSFAWAPITFVLVTELTR